MADAADWDNRLAVAKSNYQKLQNIVDSHNLKTRSLRNLAQTAQDLQDEVEQAKYEETKAEQDASTYDREFIEKRQGFPDPFRPSKIYTIQDFTLYFFFASYILFLIALVMTLPNKMYVFLTGILVLVAAVAILYRYI